MILTTQSVIRKLPPWELRKLYMALMDPHLTHGAEISLDINLPLLEKLEDIQRLFLCRLLNVGEKCMNAFLFTETAIIPLRYRRIITTLKYLKYLLLLPPDLYAAHAMRDSISLASVGKPSWIMDILFVLQNLPFQVHTLNLTCLTPEKVDVTIKSILSGLGLSTRPVFDGWTGAVDGVGYPNRQRCQCYQHGTGLSRYACRPEPCRGWLTRPSPVNVTWETRSK